MLKKSKRIISLALCIILVIAMSIPAFAAAADIPGGVNPTTLNVNYTGSIDVFPGDTINSANLAVSVDCDDANNYPLVAGDYTVSPSTVATTAGNNTYTVSFGGKTATFNLFTVTVTKLTATYSGGNVTVGNNVNPADVTVTATYTDNGGATKTANITDWYCGTPGSKTMKVTAVGDNTFTLSAYGLTTTVKAVGVNPAPVPGPTSLTATYADESVLVNTNFDKSKVKLVYNDGLKDIVIKWEDLTTKPSSTRVGTTGDNMFTVGYGGQTATLLVHGYKVDHITAAYDGDRLKVGDSVDKSKLTVRIFYTDNKQGLANPAKLNKDQYTISPSTMMEAGTTTFTVKYSDANDDYTATFDVDGYDKSELQVSDMEASYADESVLVGNEFNTSSVKVKVKYSDGSTENISWSKLTTKPSDLKVAKSGWNSYEVGFNEATATLQVHGYGVSSLKAEYSGGDVKVGSSIDKSKLKVTAVYTKDLHDKEETKEVTDYTLSAETVSAVGDNTITVTYGDKTTTFVVKGNDGTATATDANGQPVAANGNKVVAKTGDNKHWPVAIGVIIAVVLAGAGAGGYYYYSKKRTTH